MKRKIKRNMKRHLLNSSIATALALTTVPLNIFPHSAKAAGTSESTVKLRFLETTDLHDNVMDYDYYQDTPTIDYGLDRTAKLIKQARLDKMNTADENSPTYEQNSMLFDAGDLLQGNPMADYVAKVKGLGDTEVHPMFKAMDILKYDAGIVGNHEFNYGLDYLKNALQEAPYKVVNANIYKDDHDSDPTNDENYFTPYQIIDKVVKDETGNEQTIKVGVIGFAPPQIMQWDKDNLSGNVITKDIVKSAEKFIPKMKEEGADVIVAIAHSGCDVAADGQEDAENAVYSLAKVPGIDALLFGHAHVNFPGDASFKDVPGIDNTTGKINNVPAMEAGFWGNNLGVMDLTLDKVDGKWTVTNSNAALRPLTKTVKDSNGKDVKVSTVDGPDQEIVDAVKEYHDGTLNYVRGKIGETAIPMHSYFSRVMDDPSVQIVNNAQTEYVKKWIETKNPDLKDIPVISAAAPFKGGRGGVTDYTNITKGDLSIKSANDLYLFNNTLKAVKLTGAQVKEWLEFSAAQFKTIDPNKEGNQDVLDYNFRPYNFDVIDGIKYQVDVTKPPRYDYNSTTGTVINPDSHRIINFTMMDGTPIKDDQEFIVATNNYRASGGGNFPGLIGGKAEVVVDSPYENRQILMDYIKAQGTVNPVADNNWKIAPVGGTAKVTFHSSPSALTYLNQTPNVKDLGASTTKDGYETYELDQNVHVQLLGINDLHGQLDYSTKVGGQPVGGIQYLAGYLKEREATNPSNTLLVQAGDAVGASRPVSALLQDEPTIRFLNELGFDVGTIGNHEFDEGVAEMKRLIYGGEHPKTVEKYGKFEGASFPYVAANVVDEKTNELILPPYTIKEVDGVKIGFIGVVTTETPSIVTPSGVAGVKFTDETEAINKYAKELEDKDVKSIVVLAHDPGKSATDGSNPTGKVVDIAKAVDPEVDVIFGAHDHQYLNSTVKDNTDKEKLLVQSYSYGTAFSDVDLTIDPVTQDIVTKKAQIQTTFQNPEHLDAKVKSELDKYLADIAPITGEIVGTASAPISRTQNGAGESPMGNLIADAMRAKTGTQFAFMNVGGVRDEIKQAGDITWGDLFAIQPFGNDIVSEKITGEQVRALINEQFQADRYRIMQISGLKYTWSDKLPIGQKVVDIYLPDGSKIDPKAVYSVTVNNFMADGGDGFTVLKQGTERTTWSSDLDALVEYVKAQKHPIFAQIEGRITIDSTAPEAPVVDDVNDQSTSVTGKAEAGATVKVKANDVLLGTSVAKEDGTFNVTIDVQKAGTELTVTATDGALNVSAGTTVTVKDVTAPEAPVVNEVKNADKKVTGKAEAGSTVTVSNSKEVLGSASASKDGNFSVSLKSAQREGTVLKVVATDAAGNKSEPTNITVGDNTPPAAPVVNDVTEFDKKVTGKASDTFKVIVKVGTKELGSDVVDKYGSFSVTLRAAQKAGTVLTVVAVDKAGNVSKATTITVLDKTAPKKPVVNKVDDNDKKVIGKAEAGSKITVKTSRTVLGYGVADKNGSFTVTLKAVQKAGTVITVTAIDKGKNVSPVATITVVDDTNPKAPSVDKVTAKSTKVSGKAEPGTKVTVKVGNKVLGSDIADKKGKFSIKIKKQKAGTVLAITAKDKAGNVSSAKKVTVKK
ncbi:bifunctional 2',3'-cyclic-nucleotide 2'-phosphodiesterase/3'-nucleotidase [Neobacillus cucumis]|uniref:bifunctional 2',3'-cyclic-nucleotide 2'-phosphodiesterase/3'-nucleotidase n=1 Tax=Neobacillus cucumis TaxID=1740721 RepID=UPI0018DF7ADA|nr:bifunctional 2',3'-cyclic-nucleotide 2'-phosphodiesterase/3'-nucleotidase [Neobacillus cucumis]MBI0577740.1 bifunctional 2',3'-cyclic-nucleotide 2'-phosphodiesterase/3'-nucleotidase [Neobacillus cucumis]